MPADILNFNETAHPHDKEILEDVKFCREYVKLADKGIVKHHRDLKDFIESEHASEIKAMSHGMTIKEILDFYCISWDNLDDNDRFFLCSMFLKGRSDGKFKATEALFLQMRSRDGTKASLSYLSRFGENWEGVENASKKLDDTPRAIKIELIE